MPSGNQGKAYERQLMDAFKTNYPTAWVHRNVDALGHAGKFAVKSPPDLLVIGPWFNLLVECKAVKGPSLAFDRLAEHQEEHLLAFDDTQPNSYGLIGVLRYNGERGATRIYDSWLVPIGEWVSLRASLGRKSLPLTGEVAEYLRPWNAPWRPGYGFLVGSAVRALTASDGSANIPHPQGKETT